MPIYEYACRSCGARFEKLQKVSDPPLATCEKCGEPVEKLVSQTAFQLKGTGWYVTDYARKGGGGGKSEGGKADKGADADSGSKADKPAAAGEGKADKPAASTDSKPSSPAAPATGGDKGKP